MKQYYIDEEKGLYEITEDQRRDIERNLGFKLVEIDLSDWMEILRNQ